jgi:hypothetical protein
MNDYQKNDFESRKAKVVYKNYENGYPRELILLNLHL